MGAALFESGRADASCSGRPAAARRARYMAARTADGDDGRSDGGWGHPLYGLLELAESWQAAALAVLGVLLLLLAALPRREAPPLFGLLRRALLTRKNRREPSTLASQQCVQYT